MVSTICGANLLESQSRNWNWTASLNTGRQEFKLKWSYLNSACDSQPSKSYHPVTNWSSEASPVTIQLMFKSWDSFSCCQENRWGANTQSLQLAYEAFFSLSISDRLYSDVNIFSRNPGFRSTRSFLYAACKLMLHSTCLTDEFHSSYKEDKNNRTNIT